MAESTPTAERKLRALANRVAAEMVRQYGNTSHLEFGDVSLVDSSGNGPAIRIACFRNPRRVLEFWVDYSKFSGRDIRCVWFGVYSDKQLINTDRTLKQVRRVRIKGMDDLDDDGEFEWFDPPLETKLYGKTIEESYRRDWVWLGTYMATPVDDPRLARKLVDWTANWLPKLIKSADAEREKMLRELVAREGGPEHYRAERQARSAWLAKERKLCDGFRGAVCELKMADFYGAPGHRYAEAHHLDGLAKKKTERKIHVQRLITVCPNCHRMLHRMRDPADWKGLRRLIEKHGRYGTRNSRAGRQ